MNFILQLIGYGWAIIGAANIVMYPDWGTGSDAMMVGLLMFNMLLFILPGLAIGNMGSRNEKKAEK